MSTAFFVHLHTPDGHQHPVGLWRDGLPFMFIGSHSLGVTDSHGWWTLVAEGRVFTDRGTELSPHSLAAVIEDGGRWPPGYHLPDGDEIDADGNWFRIHD